MKLVEAHKVMKTRCLAPIPCLYTLFAAFARSPTAILASLLDFCTVKSERYCVAIMDATSITMSETPSIIMVSLLTCPRKIPMQANLRRFI